MVEFDEIYRIYFEDVYKYVLTLCRDDILAEEITQETFFKALKNIHNFKGNSKVYVWLCQIAKNTYFTNRQKQKRISHHDSPEDMIHPHDFEGKLVDEEKAFAVHKVLHDLEEPYKEVFTLRTFGELSSRKLVIFLAKPMFGPESPSTEQNSKYRRPCNEYNM